MGLFSRAKSENNALLPSVEQLTQISSDLGPKMAELIVRSQPGTSEESCFTRRSAFWEG